MAASIKARKQIERYLSGELALADFKAWVWETAGDLDRGDRSADAEVVWDVSGPLSELEAAAEAGRDVEDWFREQLRSIVTAQAVT
jgi:hypothetical protein